jgi:hypothetical protein
MSASTAPAATVSLKAAWELRNAAAETLIKSEEQLRRLFETADVEQVVGLLESFSPARSQGPEWTRSFDALTERLWVWCDPATLSSAEAEFRSRGQAWVPVANALNPDWGERLRAELRRGSGATRLPRFTLG